MSDVALRCGYVRFLEATVQLCRPALIAFALVPALALGPRAPAVAAEEQAGLSREAVEAIVRDYLLNNPEVVLQALQILQERQQATQQEAAREAIAANRQALFEDPDAPVGGNPEGDVTVVEFFDYRCPHCRAVAPTVTELLKQDRNVRLVYKEFPILGPDSERAARAALAADKQGKYREMHAALMGTEGELTEERILEIARGLGLDTERLKQDMASSELTAAIEKNYALATALGIRGTPAFVVGGELVPGAVDLGTLRQLVDEARKG